MVSNFKRNVQIIELSNIDYSEPMLPDTITYTMRSYVIIQRIHLHHLSVFVSSIFIFIFYFAYHPMLIGHVLFHNELEAIQREVDILKSKGINKIIAVGHSGIEKDQEIARKIKGVDIVVGGHTDTFLWTGKYLFRTYYSLFI